MQLEPDALADLIAQSVALATGPLLERLAAIEARMAGIGDVRDRVITLETLQGAPDATAAALQQCLSGLELRIGEQRETLSERLGDVCSRLAALEQRSLLVGPPGRDGVDGRDGLPGLDGRDGVDGLGFDDLSIELDGRTLMFRLQAGERVRHWPIEVPFLQYQGVFQAERTYAIGDVVTFGGSAWHALAVTQQKPGESADTWQLVVKRGRDGRDGAQGLPGPAGRPGRDFVELSADIEARKVAR